MVRWQVATSDMTHIIIMPYTVHRAEDSDLYHLPCLRMLQHNALSFIPTYAVATIDLAYRGDISTASKSARSLLGIPECPLTH
jgi:hypothetical protein